MAASDHPPTFRRRQAYVAVLLVVVVVVATSLFHTSRINALPSKGAITLIGVDRLSARATSSSTTSISLSSTQAATLRHAMDSLTTLKSPPAGCLSQQVVFKIVVAPSSNRLASWSGVAYDCPLPGYFTRLDAAPKLAFTEDFCGAKDVILSLLPRGEARGTRAGLARCP